MYCHCIFLPIWTLKGRRSIIIRTSKTILACPPPPPKKVHKPVRIVQHIAHITYIHVDRWPRYFIRWRRGVISGGGGGSGSSGDYNTVYMQWVGTRHITSEFNDVRGNVRASRVKQLAGDTARGKHIACCPSETVEKKKKEHNTIIISYECRRRPRRRAKRVRRAHKHTIRRVTGKPTANACTPPPPARQPKTYPFGTDAVSVARVRTSPRVPILTYKHYRVYSSCNSHAKR